MTKSLLIWLMVLSLLSPTLGVLSQDNWPEYPVVKVKLEGFGVKFQLALQVLGISRSVSMTDMLANPKAALHDVRIWIWKKPYDSWDIHNVNLSTSYFGKVTLCRDPWVVGLLLSINKKYQSLIYPTYLVDNEVNVLMFEIPFETKSLRISNCKE